MTRHAARLAAHTATCAHAPNAAGTACRFCGLAAEPVRADELAAVLLVELANAGAVDDLPAPEPVRWISAPGRCASSDCIGYHGPHGAPWTCPRRCARFAAVGDCEHRDAAPSPAGWS